MKALFLTDTEEKASVLRRTMRDLADVTTVRRADLVKRAERTHMGGEHDAPDMGAQSSDEKGVR